MSLATILYDCLLFTIFDMCIPANLMWTAVLYPSAALTVLFGDSSSSDDISVAFFEDVLFYGMLVSVLVLTMNLVVSKVARLHFEGKTCRNELRAAKSILAGVCDAVVEADLESRLVQPSQKLVDVLMMSPRRCLVGERLQPFMATEADSEKFTQQVTSSITHDGICSAFHVNMRDSCGISVPMEVFCVRFHNSGDKDLYLLGLREFADMPLPVRRQQRSAGLPAARLNADLQNTLHSREAGTADSCNSESETVQGSTVPEASISIDAVSPGLTILRCSHVFEMLAGISGSQIGDERWSLLQCTRPGQRDDLAYWIGRCLEIFDGGAGDQDQIPLTVYSVDFRFSEYQHRFRLTIRNNVTLVLSPPDGQDCPVGVGEPARVVKLIIDSPKWIQGARWTRTRRAASSRPSPASSPPGDPEPDRASAPDSDASAPGPDNARGRRPRNSEDDGAARERSPEADTSNVMSL